MDEYQEFLKELSNKVQEIKEYDERVERIEKEEDVHPMSKIGFLAKKMGLLAELHEICKKYVENLSLA